MSLKLHTTPETRDRTVEVSYGWTEYGALVRHRYDRSDGETVTRILFAPFESLRQVRALQSPEQRTADIAALESWDPWNGAPPAWVDRAIDEEGMVVDLASLTDEEE